MLRFCSTLLFPKGHNLKESTGPITVVSSKNRRITFQECPDDLCGMVDLAKVADLVLLVVDGRWVFVCLCLLNSVAPLCQQLQGA